MMIYNLATMAFSDLVDMEKVIDMFSEVNESIIKVYESKAGISHTQLSHMMCNTKWMNGKKAIELGFAGDILVDEKLAADISGGYAFPASAVKRTLINKILGKAKCKPEKKPVGRAVNDLRAVFIMMITEMRNERAKLWNTMEGLHDAHRNDISVLSSEDDATYAKMECCLDSMTKRMEHRDTIEEGLNKPVSQPITEVPEKSAIMENVKVGRASVQRGL